MKLTVWRRSAAGTLLAVGEIRISDLDRATGGRRRGAFRYAASDLGHPDARA